MQLPRADVQHGGNGHPNNLKLFSASYYHKVNDAVEAGVKAAYDTKSKSTVGIEVASKYRINQTSFPLSCFNDRRHPLAGVQLQDQLSGFTFGIGASLDSQKLNEAGHKIGTSFTFEG